VVPARRTNGGTLVEDFASAVLVAAVRQVLAEQGLAAAAPPPAGALVPLAVKRRLLTEVAGAHGLAPLLSVGPALARLPPHPVIAALRAATGPPDLFARWRKLERFVHSRHRVVVVHTTATSVVAEHTGPPQAPPTPAEDALILGVLAALLDDIGTRGLTVALDGGPAVFGAGGLTVPAPGIATGRWRFTWSSHVPPARPVPSAAVADPAGRSRELLGSDPVRRWNVAGLAAETAVSVRTLQRQLRPVGGFAALLGAVRAGRAADLLVGGSHPLGVVGFACGYADQPHFTREFRRRTAMTPAAYRTAFTPARSAAVPL
jgi:AraC-like DNA-binding protein